MQIFGLLLGCVFFGWQAKDHSNWRPVLLLFVAGCFLAACQELDDVLTSVFPFIYWKFGFVFSIAALLYARILCEKAWYIEVPFSDFLNFYTICTMIFVLLSVLEEITEPEWIAAVYKDDLDIEILEEEFMEALCFMPIFLLSLGIHFNKSDILDKFYAKYGDDVELEILSRKEAKIVYNVKTLNCESILAVVPNISIVRFFKYATAQGIQQRLYEDNMEVAKIEDSYFRNGNYVYVQEKIKGTNMFPKNAANMYKIGELVGKLHSVTSGLKYKRPIMFIKHPNFFCQIFIYFREYLMKKTVFSIRYFRLRKFPKGVCHRDINEKNVIMRPDGSLALIDFDVHEYLPFVEGLVRFYRRSKNKDNFLPFIRGYNTVRPLTDQEKEYLEKKLSIRLQL